MNTCFHFSIDGKRSDPLTPFEAAGNYIQAGQQEGISQTGVYSGKVGLPWGREDAHARLYSSFFI